MAAVESTHWFHLICADEIREGRRKKVVEKQVVQVRSVSKQTLFYQCDDGLYLQVDDEGEKPDEFGFIRRHRATFMKNLMRFGLCRNWVSLMQRTVVLARKSEMELQGS